MSLAQGATFKREGLRQDRIFWRVVLLTAPLGLVLLLFFPNGPLLRHYHLPNNSMAPDYRLGAYIVTFRPAFGYVRRTFDGFELPIVDRWPQIASPKRGDLIVVRPAADVAVYFKRVIGLPGDTVQMKNSIVILNGLPLPRQPIGETDIDGRTAEAFVETLPGGKSYRVVELEDGPSDNTDQITVGPDCVFVMGDNRDRSLDGRFASGPIGSCVPINRIVGKVIWHVGPKPLPPPTSRLGGRGLPEWMRQGQQ